jgi:serine O-acetyltransferase
MVFRAILPPVVEGGDGLGLNHRGLNVVVHPHVTLGKNVRLQHGVTLATDRPLTSGQRMIIGDDVSIGAGAILLGPIRVGDGAIIGAGSVVTKDVPAGEVWAGNPARRLRSAPSAPDKSAAD